MSDLDHRSGGDTAWARERFGQARVARMATVSAAGEPHLVPVVFALDGDRLWTAVDAKPKRTTALKRLANLRANPRVSLLVDHYSDDWSALWWVRVDGAARVHDGLPDAARSALAAKYPHYREIAPLGPAIEVVVDTWRAWSAQRPVP